VVVHTGRLTVSGRRWPWLAAAVLLLAVAGAAAWWTLGTRPAPAELPRARHTQVTFSGDVFDAALAPDGQTIAYTVADGHSLDVSGPSRLVVRDIEGTEALELWRGDQMAGFAWMPDGRQVLVSDLYNFKVWLVPRFGGTPRRVEGLKDAGLAVAATPDGSRIATTQIGGARYQVLSLASGQTVSRTLPDTDYYISTLSWNRRGDQLAVVGTTKDHVDAVWIAVPEDGSARRLPEPAGATVRSACWSPATDALYMTRRLQGGDTDELVRVIFRAQGQVDEEVLLTGLSSGRSCQVSTDGQRLLHVRTFRSGNLWRLDLAHPANPTAVTTGTSPLADPDVSPDGQWILATLESKTPFNLVRIPARGGAPSPFVAQAAYGKWSPDGRRVAFVSSRTGSWRIWVADGDGGNARELPSSEVSTEPMVLWWPDGRLAWPTPDHRNYRIRDLATGREEQLRAGSRVGFGYELRVSPKRDQVAAYGGSGDDSGLWLIGSADQRERLLARGDLYPIGWTADGSFIYALRFGKPEVLRVSVATGVVQTVGRFPGSLAPQRCSMTPDRSAIICSVSDHKRDAWIVDHFDPHVPPAGR
jgi:Tol biopolymer transport system component